MLYPAELPARICCLALRARSLAPTSSFAAWVAAGSRAQNLGRRVDTGRAVELPEGSFTGPPWWIWRTERGGTEFRLTLERGRERNQALASRITSLLDVCFR